MHKFDFTETLAAVNSGRFSPADVNVKKATASSSTEKSGVEDAPSGSDNSLLKHPPGVSPDIEQLSKISTAHQLLASAPFDPAFGIDNLVDLFYVLFPELTLYPWQAQELYRISGYLHGVPTGPRVHWTWNAPFKAAYVCANGSGKDKVINAVTAIGLPLLYKDVYAVITSASYDQLKGQTEEHIKTALARFRERFGDGIYTSVEFHHQIKERRGHIKLFATNEAGRAEGWHPLEPTGRLVLIVNEAKSIDPKIFKALDRCWGYSHWLEISSPGLRRGMFYNNFRRADQFPFTNQPRPHRYFGRRVSYKECPHITEEYANEIRAKYEGDPFIPKTSLDAEFYEDTETVVVPVHLLERCEIVPKVDDGSIGIGLDSAAGKDETALVVRRGNHVVYKHFFVMKDTKKQAAIVDEDLRSINILPTHNYFFFADDGGVSQGVLDNLIPLGWRVTRVLNQSTAFNKKRFKNRGAESYFHIRTLVERCEIYFPSPYADASFQKLSDQLTTREYLRDEISGKIVLKSKEKIREEGGESPDRSDAFVLAFLSRPSRAPNLPKPVQPSGVISQEEFIRRCLSDPAFVRGLFTPKQSQVSGHTTPTLLNGKL